MTSPLVVVMLDDARFGAGPGTVREVSTDPIADILARYTDRDGARPSELRIWHSYPGAKKGDRVTVEENERCDYRTTPVLGDPNSIDVFTAQGGDRPARRSWENK